MFPRIIAFMNLHRYLCQALLALLAHYTKNVYSEKPYCSLNKSAEGQWVNETYPFARSFARSGNLDVWNRDRFPWQQKYHSCYFTDGNQVHGRGFATENRRFVPSTCSYRQFSPSKFLELMRGKTLLICCDSLSYQMTVNLAGSLHYDRKEHFIYYPEYNFTLVNAYTNKYPINNKPHARSTLAEYQDFGNLRPNYDVMVINFGLHFNIGGMHKLQRNISATRTSFRLCSGRRLLRRTTIPRGITRKVRLRCARCRRPSHSSHRDSSPGRDPDHVRLQCHEDRVVGACGEEQCMDGLHPHINAGNPAQPPR